MLKYEGETVVEWMFPICDLAWRQIEVPDQRKIAIIVPLYKDKGSIDECDNYKGICLLSVTGKVYGRVLVEKLKLN